MQWSQIRTAVAWSCVAALGLLAAACGGDDARTDQTTSVQSTTEGDEISVEAAADQYMAMVAAPNCAINELNTAIDDVATTPSGAVTEDQWPAIQARVVPALVEVEATGREWASALLAAEWPPAVESDVNALALAVTESATRYGEIAATDDFDAFFELYNAPDTTAVFDASAAAAEAVRESLGLSAVTTDPPDWCALVAT